MWAMDYPAPAPASAQTPAPAPFLTPPPTPSCSCSCDLVSVLRCASTALCLRTILVRQMPRSVLEPAKQTLNFFLSLPAFVKTCNLLSCNLVVVTSGVQSSLTITSI